MKVFLFAYLLILSNCYYFFPRTYISGSTNAWIQYPTNTNGVYVEVSFADLNLKNIPDVTTYLQCKSYCWVVTGVNSVYNLTNTGFKIFLRFTQEVAPLTVAKAVEYGFVLNYMIFPHE